MTAIILLNLKKKNSVLVCADRQESGYLVDYNDIQSKDLVEFEGKKYCPVDIAKRFVGVNHCNKISNIKNKFILVGSEISNDLNKIFEFIEVNTDHKNIIEKVLGFRDIQHMAFILVDIKTLEIHYFNYGKYSLFNDEVLIFGDVKQIQEIEDNLQRCIEQYKKYEILFDQIAFTLHELSQRNYNRTIASPFYSGCNLTLIRKNRINNYKLINYFRWENKKIYFKKRNFIIK